jgi:DNA invertase Pin-like site-specific DNA recombinase
MRRAVIYVRVSTLDQTTVNQEREGLDTTTPSGKAMFQMLGVFAEFERAMTQQRVRAGLARARADGKILGRPKIAKETERALRAALQKRSDPVSAGWLQVSA